MDHLRPYYRQAIKEIFSEQGIKPAALPKEAITVLLNMDDPRDTVRKMVDILNGRDFAWPMLDRCLDYCRSHDLHIGHYRNVLLEGDKPESKEWFLQQLTIAQLKVLAKPKNIVLPKLKADIVALLSAHLSWSDLDKSIEMWRAGQQSKIRREKCYLLMLMVVGRASSLRDWNEKNTRPKLPLRIWKLELRFDAFSDEERLARGVMGGYESVVESDGSPKRLPPYFPGDTSFLMLQILRQQSPSLPRSNTPEADNIERVPTLAAAKKIVTYPQTEQTGQTGQTILANSQPSVFGRMMTLLFIVLWLLMGLTLSRGSHGWSFIQMFCVMAAPFCIVAARKHYLNSMPGDRKRKYYGWILAGLWLGIMLPIAPEAKSFSDYVKLLLWITIPLGFDWFFLLRRR